MSSITFVLIIFIYASSGTMFFLFGYFPLKASKDDFSNDDKTANIAKDKDKSKLVLVLIDALRSDFMLSDKFLSESSFLRRTKLSEHLRIFHSIAKPPTVTLPRIKALTSGSIPGFIDVIMNFGSSAFVEDNLLRRWAQFNRSMHFFGDDTWLKMFPDHFTKFDGVSSFFVSDYTEVDDNVTRHLSRELSDPTWNILILHYLGLDHIGHMHGPSHPLIRTKLTEMDRVLERIFSALLRMPHNANASHTLVAFGDHGMSEQGSHGGTSTPETSVPLLFFSTRPMAKDSDSVTLQQVDLVPTLALLTGVPIPRNSLGIAIPSVLRAAVSPDQLLSWLAANVDQLMALYRAHNPNWKSSTIYTSYRRASDLHQFATTGGGEPDSDFDSGGRDLRAAAESAYIETARLIQRELVAVAARYDVAAMIVGLLFILTALLVAASRIYNPQAPLYFYTPLAFALWFCAGAAVSVACSDPSKTSLVCSLTARFGELSGTAVNVLLAALLAIGATQGATGLAVAASGVWADVSVLLQLLAPVLALTPVSGIFCKHRSLADLLPVYFSQCLRLRCTLPIWTLLSATALAPCLALSSSFVEEEHQIAYSLATLGALFWCVEGVMHDLRAPLRTKSLAPAPSGTAKRDRAKYVIVERAVPRCAVTDTALFTQPAEGNARERKIVEITDETAQNGVHSTTSSKRHPDTHRATITLWKCAAGVALLLTLRLARCWNNTGDRYGPEPDLADWLDQITVKADWPHRPANKPYLIASILIAHVLVDRAVLVRTPARLVNVAVFLYRLALLRVVGGFSETLVSEAQLVFVAIGINLISAIASQSPCSWSRGAKHTALFIGCLLARSHNVSLIGCLVVVDWLLWWLRVKNLLTYFPPLLLYYWLGQASYFMQGNSNSLATIDLAAGYSAVPTYQPAIIAIFIALSTYWGPLYWSFSFIDAYVENFNSGFDAHCKSEVTFSDKDEIQLQAAKTILLRNIAPKYVFALLTIRLWSLLSYFCVATLMRYHLFVWSVFAPKILYESVFTALTLACCLAFAILRF